MDHTIVEVRIGASTDDAEENVGSGGVLTASSDLELAVDGTKDQFVGLRFAGLDIPPDAVITNAYVQFTVDEVSTGTAALVIGGELADNATTFAKTPGNISSRADTIASVAWEPPDWTTVGASGSDQRTNDISAIIQEIVDQSGWAQGNALALTISGSGKRTAESFNASQTKAPLLHIEFTVSGGSGGNPPVNAAPAIDLDGEDNSGATGNDFATTYVAQSAAVAIADIDAAVIDSDSNLVSAHIILTNPVAGDVLTASGLPAGITVDHANSTATALILIGDAAPADYEAAIKAVTFESGQTTVLGDRAIEVTVNDGTTDSQTATTTVSVEAPANTPPEAVADGFGAVAGVPLVIAAADLTGNDTDDDGDTLTITGVSDPANGTAVLNPDGTVTYAATSGYHGPDSFEYTVSDGNGGSATATVTIDVAEPAPAQTIEVRVAASTDDAEENAASGGILTASSDLELVTDGAKNQIVGLRFAGLDIPPDAVITNAYVQFTVDEISTGAASLTIGGELSDNAATFAKTAGNISLRADTIASVAWEPPDWTTASASGLDQRTTDISAIIQEIVGQSGWAEGNALVLTISGSGKRTAESFNGSQEKAPLLHIEFTAPGSGGSGGGEPVNEAPTVDLDGDDGSGAIGNDFATTYVAQGAPAAIADIDAAVADSDGNLASATISITNPSAGDILAAGTLPPGITVDQANSTATTLILIGEATPTDYETAIKSVTFATGQTPVLGDRIIEVTVNDGTDDSATATTTVTVTTPANTPPEAVADGFGAVAGVPLVIAASALTGNDSDADGDALTITELSDPANGTAVLNGDGTITYEAASGYSGTDGFDYTISDGNGGSATATVTIDVAEPAPSQIIEVRVGASADDAEESVTTGNIVTASSDLELVVDLAKDQFVGLRFAGLDIPPDAVITNAYVQFTVDEVSTGAASLTIGGELSDNAATFAKTNGNISSRLDTIASVAWEPPDWTTAGASGAEQRTGDISAIIQEIIDQSGWTQGNALVLTIEGTGTRTAESFNGSQANAPLLHLEFTASGGGNPGGGTPPNQAPTDFDLSAATIDEGAATDTVIGTLGGVVDANAGDTHTFTLINDAGGRFAIVGSELRVADGTLLDYETAANHDIFVRVTDDGSPAFEYDKSFTIAVGDTPESAVGIDLSATHVAENAADGTSIGALSGVIDQGAGYGFSLMDDAGGRFVFAGNQLQVADGTLLDYESSTSHDITVRVTHDTDPALAFDETFTVTIGDVIESPNEFVLSANQVTENTGGGTVVGDLVGAAGGSYGFTLLDDAGGRFAIDSANDRLIVSDNVDQSPTTIESRISVSADDVEERTSGRLSLSSSDLELVDDGSKKDQTVGLRFTDLQILQGATIVNAYIQFQVDEASFGAASFTISGQASDNAEVFVNTSFNASSRAKTDATAQWAPNNWTTVGEADADQRTTDLSEIVQEIVNRPDWAQGNAMAFFVNGFGKRTAESFNGNAAGAPSLHVEYRPSIDFEAAASHDVTIRLTDDTDPGVIVDKTFTIDVDDSNDAPTNFSLLGSQIAEASADGTVIGAFGQVIDQDATDSHTFTLLDGAGGRFTLVGGELRVADGSLLDFETTASHDIVVRVSDGGDPALSIEKTFTIDVADVNEAPTDFALTWMEVSESAPNGTLVGSLGNVVDPDAGDSHGFSLIDNAGGRFTLDGNDLRVANGSLLDQDTAASHDVVIRVTDGGSPSQSINKTITVAVRDAASIPSDFTITGGSFAESAATGTAVATLVGVLDPAIGSTHGFSLVDNAGGQFKIVGDELRIADEALIDFETTASHDVTIRATKNGEPGLVLDKTFSIDVEDVAEFTFTAIADTPYRSSHFPLVEAHLADLPEDSNFVIHLGDIKSGSSSPDPDIYYPEVADLLLTSPKPLFIILGDNEYNDMPDPDAALSAWKDSFMKFDQNWNHDFGVSYQSGRQENFSFVAENTLFVGLNMVGGAYHDPAEWDDRSADNLAWIQDRFGQHGATVDNAVIFGHANAGQSGYESFEVGFLTVAQNFDKPILYMMGDDHKWELDNPYSAAANITQVTLDKTASEPPLTVNITADPNDPFSTDHNFDGFFV